MDLLYNRVLVIDNYDSFTYNLVDYLRQLGCAVQVYRNTVAPDTLDAASFDLLLLSPGPSIPRNAGNLFAIIQRFYESKPILGICLGHQALIEFFGGTIGVVPARHGKAELIVHDQATLYAGLPPTIEVARYHSLAALQVPEAFQVSARAQDGTVMSIRHKFLPIEGLQYHPESVLSMRDGVGMHLLKNAVEGKLANGFSDYRQLMTDLQEKAVIGEALLNRLVQSLGRGHLAEDQKLVLLVALSFRLKEPMALAAFIEGLMGLTGYQLPGAFSEAVDVCGTGGSGLPRLNTSTLVALLLAHLGVPVAKHGNKAASGRFGSFDLLEALQVPIRVKPGQSAAALATTRLAFLFAPDVHPAMGHFAQSRARIGIPTLFNILGPLLNPLQPSRQLIGTAFKQYMELIFDTAILLGREELYVVRGEDGLDEISISGPTEVLAYHDGRRERFTLNPEDFGIAPIPPKLLEVNKPSENLRLAQEILAGTLTSDHYRLVAANAAFAYTRFHTAMPLTAAYQLMVETLASGALGRQLAAYTTALKTPEIITV